MYSNRNEYGSRGNSNSKRFRHVLSCGCVCCCLILVLIVIVIVAGIANRGQSDGRRVMRTASDAARNAALYSPGSTRIISYGSSFFCGAIWLQSNSTLGLTLYLIDDTPPLAVSHNFTINRSSGTTVYWSYYLYPGSSIEIEHCLRTSEFNSNGDWVFLIIRGRSNFQSWMRSPDSNFDDNRAITANSVTNRCFGRHRSYGLYTFHYENEYFFVLYNNNSDVEVNIRMSVEQFEYALSSYPQPVARSDCSTVLGSSRLCRLDVPLGSNYRALVAVDIPNNVNWEEYVDIDWHCESRAWAYIVVVLGYIAVITVAIVIICTCVWWIKKRHCQKTVQATEESHNIDLLNGEQDLTAIPPPSYAASLAYPLPTDEDKSSPPSYIECTTNNV